MQITTERSLIARLKQQRVDNHRWIIVATTELIEAGQTPTFGLVAAATGLASRTIQYHFATIADLYRECGYELKMVKLPCG